MIEELKQIIMRSSLSWFGKRVGLDELTSLQLVRNPSVHGSAIMFFFSPDRPLCVVKATREPDSAAYLKNEKTFLDGLSNSTLSENIPVCYSDGMIGSSYYVVQEYAGTVKSRKKSSSGENTDTGLELLHRFFMETAREIIPGREDFERFIARPVRKFMKEVQELPAGEQLLEHLEEELVGKKMVLTGRHGDYWPGNIVFRGATPVILDWVFAERTALPMYDAFYFLALEGAGTVAEEVDSRLERVLLGRYDRVSHRVRPLLTSLGMRSDLVPALICLFAVEAALKQMALRRQDRRGQFVVFTPSLDELDLGWEAKIRMDTFPRFACRAIDFFYGAGH